MEFVGIDKFSLLDYDEKVAIVLFSPACNFRCPFCHNGESVLGSDTFIPFDEILEYLESRKKYEGVSAKALAKINKYPYNLANAIILRVHHFYYNNFYVYKYAIGQVIALVVANKIYRGDKKMLKNYFKFLGIGESLPPLDIIKILGVDLNKSDVYAEALKIVNQLISQFKQIKK